MRSGVSNVWGSILSVATGTGSDCQRTVGFSIGIFTGSVWGIIYSSNTAAFFPVVRCPTIAARRKSSDEGLASLGPFPAAGFTVYFTARSPSLKGKVLQYWTV